MRRLSLLFFIAYQVHAADVSAPQAPAVEENPPAPMALAFCQYFESCIQKHPGKPAFCVKTGLKESGMLPHVLGGEQAKDLNRFLRKEGFIDRELQIKTFKQLPEGSILVLDAHDPIADKRPACPKVYGNVLVKCGDKWLDNQKNDLDFHMKRQCRTKGIWVHPEFKLAELAGNKKRRSGTNAP